MLPSWRGSYAPWPAPCQLYGARWNRKRKSGTPDLALPNSEWAKGLAVVGIMPALAEPTMGVPRRRDAV